MTHSKPMTGSCLCGAVTLSASLNKSTIGACHCAMCRKWSGGPMLAVDCGDSLSIEGRASVAVFDSSEWAERGFCATCGTHLYYRLKQSNHYMMPVGLFDDDEGLDFDHQIFIDKKPAYYSFTNDTHNMTEAEVFAEFTAAAD